MSDVIPKVELVSIITISNCSEANVQVPDAEESQCLHGSGSEEVAAQQKSLKNNELIMVSLHFSFVLFLFMHINAISLVCRCHRI